MHIEPKTIFTIDTLLHGTYPPQKVSVLFFHSRGIGDEVEIVDHIQTLYKQKYFSYVALVDTEGERFGETTPHAANPGKTAYTSLLNKKGIPHKVITYTTPAYNTYEECKSFIDAAKKRKWNTAITISHPHQKLRIMLGYVSVMNQADYFIKVYPLSPSVTDWELSVYGSQSLEQKPRRMHIADEYERILKYQKRGQLATFKELITYLRKRDSQKNNLL